MYEKMPNIDAKAQNTHTFFASELNNATWVCFFLSIESTHAENQFLLVPKKDGKKENAFAVAHKTRIIWSGRKISVLFLLKCVMVTLYNKVSLVNIS